MIALFFFHSGFYYFSVCNIPNKTPFKCFTKYCFRASVFKTKSHKCKYFQSRYWTSNSQIPIRKNFSNATVNLWNLTLLRVVSVCMHHLGTYIFFRAQNWKENIFPRVQCNLLRWRRKLNWRVHLLLFWILPITQASNLLWPAEFIMLCCLLVISCER